MFNHRYMDRYDHFFGDIYTFGGDIDRSSFAPVSARAYKALDDAKSIFLQHLATVDVSKGPVTAEIIKFHMVQDMRKNFNKYVKEYGCTATPRKITREEQDKVNKTRKSLMQYTSVKVTPEAQKAYLQKNPQRVNKTSSHAASSSASSAQSLGPLKDITTKSQKRSGSALEGDAINSLKKAKIM